MSADRILLTATEVIDLLFTASIHIKRDSQSVDLTYQKLLYLQYY